MQISVASRRGGAGAHFRGVESARAGFAAVVVLDVQAFRADCPVPIDLSPESRNRLIGAAEGTGVSNTVAAVISLKRRRQARAANQELRVRTGIHLPGHFFWPGT